MRNMMRGMLESRYVGYRLFLRDVHSSYAKSMAGWFWDFMDPLMYAVIFFLLDRFGIFNRGAIGMPYPVFIIYGILMYQTFVESVTWPMDVVRRSRNMLTHLKLPPEALIIATFYRILLAASFRIAIMLGFSLAMGAFSPLGFLAFVALFPVLILAGMSIGLALAPFNTVYNDVGRVARLLLLPLRFATPVMYELSDRLAGAGLGWLEYLNPLTSILTTLRALATGIEAPYPAAFAVWVGCYGVLFMAGWFLFHVSIPILAERA